MKSLERLLLLGLLAAGMAGGGPALAATSDGEAHDTLDIEGTWFVLIHFKDSSTANPDAERWQDRVWIFSRKGTRLEWTEYPLVVFQDTRGRFEAAAGNPRSRVLAAWEPNESQRRTIAGGPRVNQRGKKSKTLKGSDAEGWRSSGRRPTASASIMGYHEELSISGLNDEPTFERRDYVGHTTTSKAGGSTRYEVTTVSPSGHTLKGRYSRDGIRHGTFRMWRTKPARGLIERDTTPNEESQRRDAEAFMQEQLEAEGGSEGEGDAQP